MTFNFRDPDYRMDLSFPGKPITRRVSPRDIEEYLKAKGYTSYLSVERGWPKEIPFAWYPPERPDPRAPRFGIEPRFVRGPRLCSQPLESVIETIAQNEGRTPGEVLREIAVMAQMADE
ncbi:hypothetical protein WMF26_13080 [Sorangium sp. So ce185]|uniref:hypothetical protein n=1 Tax=Sorangium sp. So ce185 TaxID=3133287 RepID=UPI003F6141E9